VVIKFSFSLFVSEMISSLVGFISLCVHMCMAN